MKDKNHISDMLKEVWDVKESLYDEVKNFSTDQAISELLRLAQEAYVLLTSQSVTLRSKQVISVDQKQHISSSLHA